MLITNPKFSIIVFIISPLLPNIFHPVNVPAFNVINVCFIACLFSIISYKIKTGHTLIYLPRRYIFVFIMFNILLFIGSFNFNEIIYPNIAQSLISNYFKPVIIILTYIFVYNYGKNFDILHLYKIFSLIIICILISFFIDKVVYGVANKEYSGFLGTGNSVGNYLVCCLPLTLFIKNHISKNLYAKVLPLLIILAIFISGSRGSILSLLIISILYFIIFLNVNRYTKIFYIFISFSIIMIFLSQSGYLYDAIDYLDSAPILSYQYWNDSELMVETSGRLSIWSNLFIFVQENNYILFGAGIDNFLKVSDYNTQNHLLKLLIDYGIISMLLIVGAYIYVIIVLLRYRYNTNSKLISDFIKLFILSIVAVSIIGCFSHFALGSRIMSIYWMQFGLFLYYTAKKERL